MHAQTVKRIQGGAVLAGGVLYALFCGCLPTYHLQNFTGRLLTAPGTIQIERGQKELSAECNLSMSATLNRDTISFSEGSYYDFSTGIADSVVTNCHVSTAAQQISFSGAVLARRLVSGRLETRFGMAGDRFFFNVSPGIGVRLYKNYFAGRAWFNVGLAKMDAEVFVFENTSDNSASDYELRDSYDDIIPFMEMTLAFNTNFPSAPVNPFANISLGYYSLFRYDEIVVSLVPLSVTLGVFRTFGHVTASLGFRIDGYESDSFLSVHPGFVGQIGMHR